MAFERIYKGGFASDENDKPVKIDPPDALMRHGPRILVRVFTPTHPDPIECLAIIDTGSQNTFIDTAVATELQAPQVGSERRMGLEEGFRDHPIHIVDLWLEEIGTLKDWSVLAGDTPKVYPKPCAIIGRDILRHCTFTYDGTIGGVMLELKTSED